MIDLLQRVLAAHGGLERWNAFENVGATIVSGGDLWPTKGITVDSTPRRVSAAIHREWTAVAPYGSPEWRMTFVPERVAIAASDDTIVAGTIPGMPSPDTSWRPRGILSIAPISAATPCGPISTRRS
jgi:hypothetical protein